MARSAAERMKVYRKRLKAKGLRPVRLLVPDMRSPRAKQELRRQSLLISRSAAAQKEMDFIEALQAEFDPWSE